MSTLQTAIAEVYLHPCLTLTPVLVLFLYSWRLPKFRRSQILQGLAVLVPMLVYLVKLPSTPHT